MNILISCAGKQVGLINWFRKHVAPKGKIYAADQSENSPSLAAADLAFKSPPITAQEYQSWTLNTCKANQIDLLLSLYEPDLSILEQFRHKLSEIRCKLIGTHPEIIDQVTDKYTAQSFLREFGISYPDTVLLSEFSATEQHGFIIKPRRGRGSRGITRVTTCGQVINLRENTMDPGEFIVQPFLESTQFCLDIVNDFDRNHVTTLVRQRIRMGAEETDIAITVEDTEIENLARKISSAIRHQRSIDVEILRSDGKLYVIDINLRFGGSYAFSHAAGADIPGALVAWARGQKPNPSWLTHELGVTSSKYNSVIRIS